jgi:hypothetical protein
MQRIKETQTMHRMHRSSQMKNEIMPIHAAVQPAEDKIKEKS